MRQKFISVKNKKFKSPYKREDLENYLQWLGLKWDSNGERVVTVPQFKFIKSCIKEDLGFDDDLLLKITWFENGNAFSQARDQQGNQVLNILLGEKFEKFQTAFDNKTHNFVGLYKDRLPVEMNSFNF